jgi:hypothetical protein
MILQAGSAPDGPTHGITLEGLKQSVHSGSTWPTPTSRSWPRSRTSSRSRPGRCRRRSRRPGPSSPPAASSSTRTSTASSSSARRFPPTCRPTTATAEPAHAPLTPHSKWRIHSTYSNNPWLEEIHGGRPTVMIHPDDAASRSSAKATRSRCSTTGARARRGPTSPRRPGRAPPRCPRAGGTATSPPARA